MPTIPNSYIPAPKSWEEFESIVLSAAKLRWQSDKFYGNGRRGQRQDGVDIYGTSKGAETIGVQCKNAIDGITKAVVLEEITNAEAFKPQLTSLYIATTAPRDAVLQKDIRQISKTRAACGKFNVYALFWDDIINDLCLDERQFWKHYPQFAPRKDGKKEHDAKLYNSLIELLRTDGVIEFIDKKNMAGYSFDDSELDPLRHFCSKWHRVDLEFMDPQLEKLKQHLLEKANEYLRVIAIETYPIDAACKRRSVPEEWEIEQPERFAKVVNTLHDLAGELVGIYRALVRAARDYLV